MVGSVMATALGSSDFQEVGMLAPVQPGSDLTEQRSTTPVQWVKNCNWRPIIPREMDLGMTITQVQLVMAATASCERSIALARRTSATADTSA